MATLIDLAGQRFGRWLVLKRADKRIRGQTLWLCECDCGSTKIVNGSTLKNGVSKSCGCLRAMSINLAGQRFGRWLVLKRAASRNHRTYWLCECDCGVKKIVYAASLKNGESKSCDCMKVKHGMSKTPEYVAWLGMRKRCYNVNDAGYVNYGGRGIEVYEPWRKDFAAFFAHIGKRPGPYYSLDRIDNDGHYAPGNLRWATKKEQTNNRGPTIRKSQRQKELALIRSVIYPENKVALALLNRLEALK